MYNRYVPTQDGTYLRQSLPDQVPLAASPGPVREQSIGSFFSKLLPSGFEAEDLIVVLLLLLISENSEKGPNTALITLVIYLFL